MLVKFCKNRKVAKILAIMLIITMTFANVALLGKNLISYAFEENLEKQNKQTQHPNVEFDAYFSEDGGNNVHSVVFDATNNIQKMNLYLAVKNGGYLKEAYIDFRDDENGRNTNYEILADTSNSTLVQNVDTSSKTISLNYINNGTEAVIDMPIKFDFTELMQINKINQTTNVSLRGIYVDEAGEETEITKTIKLNIGWNIEEKLNLEQSITKYIKYENNEKKETMIQVAVNAKTNDYNIGMPVKSTELTVQVPKLYENLPSKIEVIAGSTMATNGNKVKFTNDNWNYDEESQTIRINTNGYEENGTVWAGVGEDTYFITYIYEMQENDDINELEETLLYCKAKAKMEIYTPDGVSSIETESEGNANLTEKIGDIVTYSVQANNEEISKGNMYANCNSNVKLHNTEYAYTVKANISNPELVNELNLNLSGDNFVDDENTYTMILNNVNYSQYKQIAINAEKMHEILGEDGQIEVSYNSNNYTATYEINKETEQTDGQYIVNFDEVVGEVTINSSKPIANGILEIDVKKIISKDLAYEKEQLIQVNGLKINIEGNANYNVNVDNSDVANSYATIPLTQTSTNAKLEISNTQLTSMVENKNVEMKIILNNDKETSDLYRNPVFTISLPKYIEDIEITSGNILYSTGLSIDYVEKNNTENGIVLKLYTKGTETDFSDGVFSNGTNIVLNTNIKVNSLTPNIVDKITLDYTNENAVSYFESETNYGKDEVEIEFVAPEEMITMNSILGNSIEAVTSTEGNEETAKLEILDGEKIATMKLTIISKYSNICNNIQILGRIPFKGNKSITTNEELGTTFDVDLVSAITSLNQLQNMTVYYSDNGEATRDLNDEKNNWTLNRSELSEVKSYLIVLPDYEMQPGEKLEFSYDVQIPSELQHNENAFGTYAVYFDSVSNYTTENVSNAPKVGLTTGTGANMGIKTTAIYNSKELKNDEAVKEYQTITYKTVITNTGSVDAENVILNSTIENATPTEYKGAQPEGNIITWDITTIPAGESRTVEYSVEVNEMNEDVVKVTNKTTATAENFEGTLKEEKINSIEKAEFKMDISTTYNKYQVFTNGQEISFTIIANNITDKTINNVVIESKLPEELEYVTTLIGSNKDVVVNYDEQTKVVTGKLNSLAPGAKASITIKVKVNAPYNVGTRDVAMYATASADGIEKHYTKNYMVSVMSAILTVEHSVSVDNNSYMKENDEITFITKVKNAGSISAGYIRIKHELPQEFKVKEAIYTYEGTTKDLKKQGTNTYSVGTEIPVGAEITVKVTGVARLLDEYLDEKTIQAVLSVTDSKGVDISTKTNIYTIEKQTTAKPGGDDTKPSINTYKISGNAWMDENNNGQMDTNEKSLEGINVMLINAQTGGVVQDIVNGTSKITKTSAKGAYSFTNIPSGKYIVLFEYDTNYYDITEYNKQGVSADKASKAISTNANIDGVLKLVGITNVIEISNSSVPNVNIGLVEKPKFDLSLQKSISKVTVENKSGVKEYNFSNSNLAKVEIPAKYVVGSKVTIEYKIAVKNEGAVEGYAKKIVDYIPKNMENLSSNWYKGKDGNLYSEELSDVLIKPGETKEVTLKLTKKLTSGEAVIINNTAEIYETYNEQNLKDVDSTPGNSAQGEDDLSKADTIITIKTGQVVIYITITLICVTILAGGIYLINKKVLKGGKI